MISRRPISCRDIPSASRAHVIVAFLLIYGIWGSTYLAIRFAVETLPPFLMAGTRFAIAGAILYFIARRRGAPRPSFVEWRWATVIGGLLLLGGNGAVVSVAHAIPSGLSSLVVATVTFWMVGFDWLLGSGRRPSPRVLLGLAIGFAGLAILLGPGKFTGTSDTHVMSVLVLLFGSCSWALGSILSRRARLTGFSLLDIAMKQTAGGVLLFVAGIASGELGSVDLRGASVRSVTAFVYLLVFGSMIGFTAYIWLLQVSTPARVATYAYVNPVIAVFLGWLLGGEQPTALTLIGSAVVLSAVVVVTTARADSVSTEPPVALAPGDEGAAETPEEGPVPAAADLR